MAESHWDLCDFKNISPAFEATLSYFIIMPFLWNFHDFRVFVFGYRAPNENPEITENFYFWIYKVQMHVDLFFDHNFNFLNVKTEKNKNMLTNLEGLESFERQKYGT